MTSSAMAAATSVGVEISKRNSPCWKTTGRYEKSAWKTVSNTCTLRKVRNPGSTPAKSADTSTLAEVAGAQRGGAEEWPIVLAAGPQDEPAGILRETSPPDSLQKG